MPKYENQTFTDEYQEEALRKEEELRAKEKLSEKIIEVLLSHYKNKITDPNVDQDLSDYIGFESIDPDFLDILKNLIDFSVQHYDKNQDEVKVNGLVEGFINFIYGWEDKTKIREVVEGIKSVYLAMENINNGLSPAFENVIDFYHCVKAMFPNAAPSPECYKRIASRYALLLNYPVKKIPDNCFLSPEEDMLTPVFGVDLMAPIIKRSPQRQPGIIKFLSWCERILVTDATNDEEKNEEDEVEEEKEELVDDSESFFRVIGAYLDLISSDMQEETIKKILEVSSELGMNGGGDPVNRINILLECHKKFPKHRIDTENIEGIIDQQQYLDEAIVKLDRVSVGREKEIRLIAQKIIRKIVTLNVRPTIKKPGLNELVKELVGGLQKAQNETAARVLKHAIQNKNPPLILEPGVTELFAIIDDSILQRIMNTVEIKNVLFSPEVEKQDDLHRRRVLRNGPKVFPTAVELLNSLRIKQPQQRSSVSEGVINESLNNNGVFKSVNGANDSKEEDSNSEEDFSSPDGNGNHI